MLTDSETDQLVRAQASLKQRAGGRRSTGTDGVKKIRLNNSKDLLGKVKIFAVFQNVKVTTAVR